MFFLEIRIYNRFRTQNKKKKKFHKINSYFNLKILK